MPCAMLLCKFANFLSSSAVKITKNSNSLQCQFLLHKLTNVGTQKRLKVCSSFFAMSNIMTTSSQKYFKTCDVILYMAVIFFGLDFSRSVLNMFKKTQCLSNTAFYLCFYSKFWCSGNTFLVATKLKFGLTHSNLKFLCFI